MPGAQRTPRVLAVDAGGTMTDTFIVDETGEFVVGKAQSTPEDEAEGLLSSAVDALRQWDTTPAQAFPQIVSGVFSGTAMLNRLLTRSGLNVGVIVTAGHEDILQMERGIQTYLGYSYADRLHVATHHHNEPLVPRNQVLGVRGRIDLMGAEALPLREGEAREAAQQLLDAGVDAICVCLLYAYRNPAHELRVGEILAEEKAARGLNGDLPVFLSSEFYPSRREFPRLNSTVIEAYAAEPSRATLRRVRERTAAYGAGFELRVMAAHGGTVSIDSKQLATTLVSGPIGGVIGAGWLAERLGARNVICTDIGGTSFDIGLITDGRHELDATPDVARFLLSSPNVLIDSVGAGTGSYVRFDPFARRPEVSPDSAGARIGVCWPEGGVDTVTVTDLNLILGRLNPDYFLGGDIDLDVERARREVARQLAEPLNLGVEAAAAGILELFESSLRNEATGRVLGKGYSPVDYTLLCYGGGGPLHVAGYTEGVPYAEVLVPAWAAGFSAFGCACADFELRLDRTVDLPLLPVHPPEQRVAMAGLIEATWAALRESVAAEFAKSGFGEDDLRFTHAVRMQYYGQLIDIELDSPVSTLQTQENLEALISAFNAAYRSTYARSAPSPELGYLVTQAIVRGSVDVEKPRLPTFDEVPGTPPLKGGREVWWRDGFVWTDVYEMDQVLPGHAIQGPAVIEAPATTFAIPPGRQAWLDRHQIFHLETR
ncbi:MAG TPA: hydantoinase/oxoprolinase family protein [Thermoleophilaceae bacterium]|nr:hydantoinase/oxoprolinase family protein [Thermoleophilaceae bacterium]